ncbi:hypothetical protein RB195_003688 [Necator americanus]|uniref:Uncharacterized protein n=1 Tax=Necator americanus TaxID=51031 RepID=A0ABR1DPQ7_NECAM
MHKKRASSPDQLNRAACLFFSFQFNLGVPALVAPVLGGITAALTCNADGSWRTNNLPMAQIGMSITRVWCLTPLGVLPPGGMPGIPGLPAMPALPGAMIPAPG